MNDWQRLARAGWPVVAGVLLGLLAASLWTLAQSDRYRADARLLVRGARAAGVLPAVEALGEGSILEENVRQTLRLTHRPHVRADLGKGGVVTLSVEASSRERARQIDAEAAVVLTQLVDTRFGSDGVEATVLDPAHPAEQTSPTPARNHLVGGLIGLVLGVAAALALAPRRELPSVEGADPDVERRLRARVEAVAKRERALARRAGELAKRDADIRERERQLVERTAAAAVRDAVPRPSPQSPAEPEPEPEPEVLVSTGRWNLNDLEELLPDRGTVDPAQYEEWMTYLFFLRQHAQLDGTLPASFDTLVNDVFASLMRREG